jgi:L-seryl-tRNA(Ser) seleniumtransferase
MSDPRRRIPAIHALLAQARAGGLGQEVPPTVLAAAARDLVTEARRGGGAPPADGWVAALGRRLAERERPSLSRVVNATGVVLHTNLGRAPLPEAARHAMQEAAGYSALEYELDEGARGSRQRHCRGLLTMLTGADDALVTVNAASAVLLALTALASDGETVVSRGELVEIGGGFRIPEILARSGTRMVEVGTTNRTRLADYEAAAGAGTRAVLKVHRSNFAMTGFVAEATVGELARRFAPAVPVVHDVGSGLLLDLTPWGLTGEPLVRDSVAAGALTIFSGDKLLGGPQAGLVAGPRALVERLARDPLARAVRPDKMTLAGLEATLALYRDADAALRQVPVLRMLTADPADLKRRARRLARRLPGARLVDGASAVGGGSFPGVTLPTTLVSLTLPATDAFLAALRRHDPPVIARAAEGAVLFDPRTLSDDETPLVAEAVARARRDTQSEAGA